MLTQILSAPEMDTFYTIFTAAFIAWIFAIGVFVWVCLRDFSEMDDQ